MSTREMTTSENELICEASRWARVVDYPLSGDYEGLYAPAKNLILLDVHLSPIQRRCVLAHEISHARHRDTACEHDGAMEARADREAARMLLSVVAYAAAEQVYDGNTHMMALELGVMPWVVDAYREWLHDNPNMAIQ